MCTHPRTGVVTSHPDGNYQGGSHAATDVCDQPECIAEAMKWVKRYARRKAYHVPDEVSAS